MVIVNASAAKSPPRVRTPLRSTVIAGAKAVAAGFFHSAALNHDGLLKTWGKNGFGQLGNGSRDDSAIPIAVAGLNKVAAIAAHNDYSVALKNDGGVLAWGWNGFGQLGTGNDPEANVPRAVRGPAAQGFLSLGVSSYQGHWNQPENPGWGVSVTQHGSMLFASWRSYDAGGKAIWLVIPGGAWSDANTFRGNLYRTSGQNTGTPFSPGMVTVTPVGSASFAFADADHATLSYTFDGVAGTRSISRFEFATSGETPGVNYSDVWWNPSEPGWGMPLTQQFGTIFGGWNTYDGAGNGIWFVLPGGNWTSPTSYSGTLYRTASTATGTALELGTVSVTAAGSARLEFIDSDHLELHYSVDGSAGTKNMTRLTF